ncbi:hypothetical protein DL96DRAFT_534396 [Flagelloscypha sp. PMI_526]|nr:hypothetical protein DL96DRAFT_534396 [Flagelloscypha sp. PMI_526]
MLAQKSKIPQNSTRYFLQMVLCGPWTYETAVPWLALGSRSVKFTYIRRHIPLASQAEKVSGDLHRPDITSSTLTSCQYPILLSGEVSAVLLSARLGLTSSVHSGAKSTPMRLKLSRQGQYSYPTFPEVLKRSVFAAGPQANGPLHHQHKMSPRFLASSSSYFQARMSP